MGKIKEKYIRLGIEEFTKRLKPYAQVMIIEVAEEQAPAELVEKEMEQVLDKEGERIGQHIKRDQHVFVLDIQGKHISSEQFAENIEQLGIYGKSKLTFVIGGSNGLSSQVKQRADERMSFSTMTFPHQMFRLILLEQVYRAFKIMRGEPYHK